MNLILYWAAFSGFHVTITSCSGMTHTAPCRLAHQTLSQTAKRKTPDAPYPVSLFSRPPINLASFETTSRPFRMDYISTYRIARDGDGIPPRLQRTIQAHISTRPTVCPQWLRKDLFDNTNSKCGNRLPRGRLICRLRNSRTCYCFRVHSTPLFSQ